MECLLAIVFFLGPRGALVVIWLLTEWINKAYETALIPFLGFVFFPWTTLAYIPAMYYDGGWEGGWKCLFVVAFIVDLCSWGTVND